MDNKNLIVKRMSNGELVGALPTHGIFKWSKVEDLEDFCQRYDKTFKIISAREEDEEAFAETI